MFVIAAVCALVACDDRGSVPQSVIDQAKKAERDAAQPKTPKRPTTQQLVEGHRSRTALIPLPLTMEMPPGWGKLQDLGDAKISASLNLLQGYTPHGEVQIQLASRPAMKQDALNRLVEAGKKEQTAKPQKVVRFELRPLGNVKVLERQVVGDPAPYTVYDANNQPHTTTESSFTWTIQVLVPNEGAYQVYELNFMGLTKSLYDQDKDFLEGILKTLQYGTDTSSGTSASPVAGATTAPTTLP
jgi:hypothetical protein